MVLLSFVNIQGRKRYAVFPSTCAAMDRKKAKLLFFLYVFENSNAFTSAGSLAQYPTTTGSVGQFSFAYLPLGQVAGT